VISRLYQIKKLDWVLIITVLLLVSIGLLSIYSISRNGDSRIFERQLFYVIFGFFLMFVFFLIDYRIFRDNNFFLLGFYFFGILLLLFVLLIGKEIRGTSSWLQFGQFSFEPVELIKLALILILAKYFSFRHVEAYRLRHLIISGLYILLPLTLLFLQPEAGYILVITIIWLTIVIGAGIKLKHLLLLALIGIIFFSISWLFLLKDYQQERILSFLNPHSDPFGTGYNIIQSIITVGSGKLSGKGLPLLPKNGGS